MLDNDGYPDDKSLKQIAKWDVLNQGLEGLLNLIRDNTKWADRQIRRSGKRIVKYEYHTGGWSGNESVIEALYKNMFWVFFWQKSTRGGHFYFRIDTNLTKGA